MPAIQSPKTLADVLRLATAAQREIRTVRAEAGPAGSAAARLTFDAHREAGTDAGSASATRVRRLAQRADSLLGDIDAQVGIIAKNAVHAGGAVKRSQALRARLARLLKIGGGR